MKTKKSAQQADLVTVAANQLEKEVRAALIKFQKASGIKVERVEIGIGKLYALSIDIQERAPK